MAWTRRVIVVGGGPAGIMAAGTAARHGAAVALVEKMDRPGRKLRITGKGRCNITNDSPRDAFLQRFGSNGRFLKPAFHEFFVSDLRDFLDSLGIATVTERGNRVFPAEHDAPGIADALTEWIRAAGVVIRAPVRAERLLLTDGAVSGVAVRDRTGGTLTDLAADAVVIATGGMSYPLTGSTGDGYRIAEIAGHTATPLYPSLVPLETKESPPEPLRDVTLRNVAVSLWTGGKKRAAAFGEVLFTPFGLSGPVVLTLSGRAVTAIRSGMAVELAIDLKPALDHHKLDLRLQRDFENHPRRPMGALLRGLLPPPLVPLCLEMTDIPADRTGNQVTAGERRRLRLWLKDFRIPVTGHRSFDEAIITAGGINLKEVEPRTMASRCAAGLFFAGEVLDIHADTGGYNLQAAFSTGFLAGVSAAGGKGI